MLIQELIKEQERLISNIAFIEQELFSKQEGELHLKKSHNTYQYALRLDKSEKEQYLSKKNMQLISQLAQQEYYEQLLSIMQKKLNSIDNAIKTYNNNSEDFLYKRLPAGRKELVKPIDLPDDEYVKTWLEQPYEGKAFSENSPYYFTNNKERVRSKSEKIIIDAVCSKHLPYKYECPLFLKNFGTVYPDITILNIEERKEYYWEHFGMMDDPEYSNKAIKKINAYIRAGYIPGKQLITTFESKNCPLDTRIIDQIIRKYFS